jgi:hypothetical protein
MAAIALPGTDLATLADKAREYAEAARSAKTVRAYRSDMAHFEKWAASHDLSALPATPNAVAALVLIRTVADFTEPVEEHRTAKRILLLALVQADVAPFFIVPNELNRRG